MAILKIVMVVIFTTGVVEAQSAIQPSKLPCKSCMGLEGYVWCGKYQSPFADTWCDNVIDETVCLSKIASKMDQCDDIEYDPDNGTINNTANATAPGLPDFSSIPPEILLSLLGDETLAVS